MAKVAANIAFAESYESAPDVWKERIIEKKYYADVVRNTRRLTSADVVNDGIILNNELTILEDAYTKEHIHDMRYICWQGSKWEISNVEVKHPRLILTIGRLIGHVQKA